MCFQSGPFSSFEHIVFANILNRSCWAASKELFATESFTTIWRREDEKPGQDAEEWWTAGRQLGRPGRCGGWSVVREHTHTNRQLQNTQTWPTFMCTWSQNTPNCPFGMKGVPFWITGPYFDTPILVNIFHRLHTNLLLGMTMGRYTLSLFQW